jgi:nitric oxide reductase activation protein
VTLSTYKEEFQRLPGEIAEAFSEAWDALVEVLTEEELVTWADNGLAIAQRPGRSWEAAIEYFKASPSMAQNLPFIHLKQWGYWGNAIAEESPIVSRIYFKASPQITKSLKPWDVPEWAQLGKKLYGRGSRSGVLSARYFEVSGDILDVLSFSELQHLVVLVESIAERSVDEAAAFLSLSRDILPALREDTRSCLSLISILVREDWQQATACLEVVEEALSRIERVERSRFLALAGRIAEGGDANIPAFLRESSVALGQVEGYTHVHLLNLADNLSRISTGLVLDYIKGIPQVLRRVSINQLEAWYETGVSMLTDNQEGAVAFFKGESARSEEVLERLSMGVELVRVKEIMRLYCRALSALDVEIAPQAEESSQGKGWVALEKMMAEGATVYLPPVAERFNNKEENFDWYKVVATHQVAHLEFSSFQFSFDTPATQFSDMRSQLVLPIPEVDPDEEQNVAEGEQAVGLADIQRFFAIFVDGVLARDIFTAVEDCRLDHRVKIEYPGIRKAYTNVQRQSLEDRPSIDDLPAKEAMVELLIRFSLQQGRELMVSEKYSQWAKALWDIVKPLSNPQALVEDSAEATIRLYQIISQVHNVDMPEQELEQGDSQDEESGGEEMDEEQLENMLKDLMDSQSSAEGDEEQTYQSPPQVDYRGDFKPELMQVISLLRESQKKRGTKGDTISKGEMEKLLSEANQPISQADVTDTKHQGMFTIDMIKEVGSKGTPQGAIRQSNFSYDPGFGEEEQGGPLDIKEPASFLYDEWDYRMSDYRSRWCLLREKEMAEGDSSYFSTTLDSYAALASQIRRQFELMVPQGLQKMKRQQDGDELELDAVIEAIVDKRSGTSPSEKVYLRRNKIQRDVAVVFLLDMSASTAEAIDESRRLADEWDAPDDPLEYMFWLRSRRGEGVRRSYKRIVDVEKESIVLIIHALEAIGDTYGIYGFSGYGRENVDFFVIKDIKEPLSEKVKRRIDKVAPLQATRMGPAIRHAVNKLDGLEARTKFLVLISDGRPQDRGYSREGVEKEYAIHDTRVALLEARRKGITPFCLTVDKEGHDYLRAMCQDMGYEVLADIHSLPRRLPTLYRRLTV